MAWLKVEMHTGKLPFQVSLLTIQSCLNVLKAIVVDKLL